MMDDEWRLLFDCLLEVDLLIWRERAREEI